MSKKNRVGPGTYDNRIREEEARQVLTMVGYLGRSADSGDWQGSVTGSVIAGSLGIHPLRVQQALAMMEEQGLIYRRGKKTDWRQRWD